MEVIYELSQSDVSQLFRYIRHRRNGIRPVFLFSFLSVFASVGLAVAGFSLSDAYHHMGRIPNDVAFNTVLMMCFVFFVAYFFIFRLFVLERQAWRNPQVVSEKTMRISPTGVFVRHSLGEVTLHWPLIVDVIDDRDCFYSLRMPIPRSLLRTLVCLNLVAVSAATS